MPTSPKLVLWLGAGLLLWPGVAAFLSGLLFAQGRIGTFVARIAYYGAFTLGTPSMIVGAVIVLWGTYIWFKTPKGKSGSETDR